MNFTASDALSGMKNVTYPLTVSAAGENSSKFYEFKNDQSKSVEKISQDVLKLLEGQNLSESEKGEVVLKVLRKIMKFSNSKDEKLA